MSTQQMLKMAQRDSWLGIPLVSALLLAVLPRLTGAQVSGIILDGEGQAVDGAAVELWRPLERTAVRLTGPDGVFRFDQEESADAVALYVTRLGFAPVRAAVAPGATDVRVILAAEGVPLPKLVVETADHFCPNEEDAEAVALWSAARAGYVTVEERGVVGARFTGSTGRVAIGDVGSRPTRTADRGERGSAGSMHERWRERIRTEGYAWSLSTSSMDGRFEAWEYPPLEADFAGHFADSLFLALHALSTVRAEADGWVIGFCPRSRGSDRPVIEGTITLATDTTFVSAEWRFRTIHRFPENAGGRVIFAPRSDRTPAYLLPIEGWYWREVFPGEFVQHWLKYEAWVQQGR